MVVLVAQELWKGADDRHNQDEYFRAHGVVKGLDDVAKRRVWIQGGKWFPIYTEDVTEGIFEMSPASRFSEATRFLYLKLYSVSATHAECLLHLERIPSVNFLPDTS